MEEGEILAQLFDISEEPETSESFTTILYHKGVSLEQNKTEDLALQNKNTKGKSTCFNCGDDHNLRDCPKHHNALRITQNRAKFLRDRKFDPREKRWEFTRYHKEIDDRFSRFNPGTISSELRIALGLSKDQLPGYIYNMRRLGYPPGWLEEARISHSGINMLDSNGERVPDADEEEGEICSSRIRYDISKIVNYPGFNVWPDIGTKNETELYQSLPMCYEQSKDAFITRLNESANNKNTNKAVCSTSYDRYNLDEDMDLEELDTDIKYDEDGNTKSGFIPPLPEDAEPIPPPPPPEDIPSPSKSKRSSLGKRSNSEMGGDQECSSEEEEGELPSKSAKIQKTKKVCEETDLKNASEQEFSLLQVTPNDYSNTANNDEDTSEDQDVTINTFGQTKFIEIGTPVLSHSSYSSLPSPEKFRKDITDVIYFENLPNSTGKYERLKGVLRSVRAKLNVLRRDPSK